MKKRKLFSLFIVALPVFNATAQENTKHLGLQEAISASVTNNMAVKLAAADEDIAKTRYRQANAIFLPQVNFSYTALSTNNPLNAFGFKLQQKSISASDFNPALLNDPSATSDFTTKLEIQQPLVNMDMLYQRKAAASQADMYKLISRRTKEALGFETEKAYLQLQLIYEMEKVLKDAYGTSKSFYKNAKDYFDQGLVQKSDLLNAQLQVTNLETQLNTITLNIADASDMLSLLMGSAAGTVYEVDSIEKNKISPVDSLQVSDKRSDFAAMKKAMESYDLMIKSSRMSYWPRLNAFGSYQFNDKSMFGFNANAYLAGIQLSWNIFNGNRTKTSISLQNAEKDKIRKQLEQQKSEAGLQVNHAKRQLADALFSMKQHEQAVEQATEALRVLQNRYTQGLVKTSDVLLAQTQLYQQRLNAVQAIYNYNLAAANLQFLTTNK